MNSYRFLLPLLALTACDVLSPATTVEGELSSGAHYAVCPPSGVVAADLASPSYDAPLGLIFTTERRQVAVELADSGVAALDVDAPAECVGVWVHRAGAVPVAFRLTYW